MGATLSRIVVPHPGLEPLAVEILYTAYSGWISSGLKKWNIDKIKLSDSYGKSLSHCKKDLVLESKIPVTMKLFPGDCNLPKEPEITTTEEIDPFFLTEPNRKIENVTVVTPVTSTPVTAKIAAKPTTATLRPKPTIPTSAPTTLMANNRTTEKISLVVDGFPAYVNDYNDSESAETNKIIIDAVAAESAVRSPQKNYTIKIIRKQEITEPILQPKSSGRNLKGEIDEPVLKAIEKVQIIEKTTEATSDFFKKSSVKPRGIDLRSMGDGCQNGIGGIDANCSKLWMRLQEMHPPPLGWNEFWGTAREPKTINRDHALFSPAFKRPRIDALPMTLQSKMAQHEKMKKFDSKSIQKFYGSLGNSFVDYPKNEDGSVTVQLFPQYLASILRQAEQYAKANFFGSVDINNKGKQNQDLHFVYKRNKTDGKVEGKRYSESVATPRDMGPPKNFFPRIYEYIEKGFESMKSLFGHFISRDSSTEANGNEVHLENERSNSGNTSVLNETRSELTE